MVRYRIIPVQPVDIAGYGRVPVVSVIYKMPVADVLYEMQIVSEIQVICFKQVPKLTSEFLEIIC